MLKVGVFSWIVLTTILLLFPLGFLFYFLFKDVTKYLLLFWNKILSEKTLHRIRNEILQENLVNTYQSEEVLEEADVSSDLSEEEKPSLDELVDREFSKKKKKLIEKIVYEALVYRKEWKLEEYEKKIIEWLAIDPNDRDLNKLLADFYFNLWNYKKALSLLKKIIEIDPQDHKAIWQIGEMYLITWDFETAELLIDKAISINQSNPKYYISMVEVFYNTDRKKDAVDIMEKVVKLRPTNPSYLLTLADLYLELQDYSSAKKYYFRVLEYEPSNEKAKQKLKELA